jgi:hypothetical protein
MGYGRIRGHQFSTDIRSATFLESGRDDGRLATLCNTFRFLKIFFTGDGIGVIPILLQTISWKEGKNTVRRE